MPESSSRSRLNRRTLLVGALAAVPAATLPGYAAAALLEPRRLRFLHTHTSERLEVVYAERGRYLPEALAEINHLLRDFRTGHVHAIDPSLLDVLHEVQQLTGGRRYEIISGFRSPFTNEMLRNKSGGVAQRSLHMDGKAIDVRLPGVPLAKLRQAALSLQAGGVGYYPGSDFVHLDTGRVRFW